MEYDPNILALRCAEDELTKLRDDLARVKEKNARMDEALKVAKGELVSLETLFAGGNNFDVRDDFISQDGCLFIAEGLRKAIAVIDEARREKVKP